LRHTRKGERLGHAEKGSRRSARRRSQDPRTGVDTNSGKRKEGFTRREQMRSSGRNLDADRDSTARQPELPSTRENGTRCSSPAERAVMCATSPSERGPKLKRERAGRWGRMGKRTTFRGGSNLNQHGGGKSDRPTSKKRKVLSIAQGSGRG